MKREIEEMIFESLVRFRILPFKGYDTLKIGSTTPSVENLETWIAKNTGAALTVTNFTNGADAQVIYILGDGFTTVANNANIKTNTGANKLLLANLVYSFHYINNVWYEEV